MVVDFLTLFIKLCYNYRPFDRSVGQDRLQLGKDLPGSASPFLFFIGGTLRLKLIRMIKKVKENEFV